MPRTAATPLTLEEARALDEFLKLWSTLSNSGRHVYSYVGLSPQKAARLAAGTDAASSALLRRAARKAGAWVARHDDSLELLAPAERARLTNAVGSLGQSALDHFRENHEAETVFIQRVRSARRGAAEASAATSDARSFVVPDGVSLAPFLSATGTPVLLVLNGQQLDGMAEVATAPGWLFMAEDDGTTARGQLDASRFGEIVAYFNKLLGEGVYLAPWVPHEHPAGGAWVVVDGDHRLVAVLDFSTATGRGSAWQDAQALLQVARDRSDCAQGPHESPPTGWHDPYEDGNDDLGDCGEEWKQ